MALVYAFDSSVLKKRDDGDEIVLELSIVRDSAYVKDVYAALTAHWKSNELRPVGLFSFALTNLQQNANDLIDQHEMLAETVIQEKGFVYIFSILLEKSSVFQTEFHSNASAFYWPVSLNLWIYASKSEWIACAKSVTPHWNKFFQIIFCWMSEWESDTFWRFHSYFILFYFKNSECPNHSFLDMYQLAIYRVYEMIK